MTTRTPGSASGRKGSVSGALRRKQDAADAYEASHYRHETERWSLPGVPCCQGGDVLLACQLCPASPTYWRAA